MTRRPSIAELLGDETGAEPEADIIAAKETLGEGFGGDTFTGHAFAEAHRDLLVYIPERGHWLEFDGQRWARCEAGLHMQNFAARTVTKAVDAEARMKHATFAAKERTKKAMLLLQTRAKQTAALAAASEMPAVRVKAESLDADPWLMGMPNGVLDLRRGRLVPAKPRQYITKQAGTPFDPEARAPQWQAFLKAALPDPAMRAFARRAVGYSLIGIVDEEKLFFAYGPGASGKSTFANVVEAVFGEYAVTITKALLVRGKYGDQEAERQVARLPGARLASINETARGDVFDDAKLKQVTSRERIVARRLYAEAFDFMPTHTTWLRGNFLPGVQDAGDGFWRRLVPIEFGQQVPETERIPDLDRRIIAEELPGVLAWAVRGAMEWQESGLGIPKPILAAVESYRESTDFFKDWLEESTRRDPRAKTAVSELFDSWVQYAHRGNFHPGTKRAFSEELVRRGYERDKSNKQGRRIAGISLSGGFDALD